jgi:hypothetical protein
MKKDVVLFGLLLVLLFSGSFFVSAFNSTQEKSNISAAYNCLDNEILTKSCSRMSLEEMIMSSLTLNECTAELDSKKSASQACWPSPICDLKTTAQVALAKKKDCQDVSEIKTWLLNQKITASDLIWYLEIDSNNATTCEITYNHGSAEVEESYTINVAANKQVSGNAGSCLSLAFDGYWYKIDKTCYDSTFEISCDKSFVTTLLFQKQDSQTYHVLKDSHDSSASGTTTEKIESYCFGKNGICDYEGSLWASLVLDYFNEDISPFLPYLMDGTTDYTKDEFLPEVFLYSLTLGIDYRTSILEKFEGKFWDVSGNRYYDTGLALWPFYYENIEQKDLAKEWLFSVQEESGCWNSNNIYDTSWLLYTLWPKLSPATWCSDVDNKTCSDASDCNTYYCEDWTTIKEDCIDGDCVLNEVCENTTTCEINSDCGSSVCPDGTILYAECINQQCLYTSQCGLNTTDDDDNCVDFGFSCTSTFSCGATNILYEYDCAGGKVCCEIAPEEETCASINGTICNYGETCEGGTGRSTSDVTRYGQTCCIGGGTCEIKTNVCTKDSDCDETGKICGPSGTCIDDTTSDGATCSEKGGICEIGECGKGYSSSIYSCPYNDNCCIEKTISSKWWIWVLFAFIVLIVLGIIFRDKLQELLIKLKTKFSKSGKSSSGRPLPPRPMMPPVYPRTPIRRPIERKVLPPQQQASIQRPMIPQKKPSQKSKEELDEVLKKLKEMGK